MKVLQCGSPKCGNFWLYNITREILSFKGFATTSFIEQQSIFNIAETWDLNYPGQARIDVLDITDLQCRYRISSIYQMPVDDFDEYVSKTSHVWTHSPICKISSEVYSKFDKIVYIIRDPRDRALSAATYYTSDYMLKYFPQKETDPLKFLEQNFEKLMVEWVWHVYDHIRLSEELNIHIIYFELLKNDFKEEFSKLADYFDLDFTENEIKIIEDKVSFHELKKNNPKHLNKGTSGYWKELLNNELQIKAEEIAGPLLTFLGYPLSKDQPFNLRNRKNHIDFETLKYELIESQQNYHTPSWRPIVFNWPIW